MLYIYYSEFCQWSVPAVAVIQMHALCLSDLAIKWIKRFLKVEPIILWRGCDFVGYYPIYDLWRVVEFVLLLEFDYFHFTKHCSVLFTIKLIYYECYNFVWTWWAGLVTNYWRATRIIGRKCDMVYDFITKTYEKRSKKIFNPLGLWFLIKTGTIDSIRASTFLNLVTSIYIFFHVSIFIYEYEFF